MSLEVPDTLGELENCLPCANKNAEDLAQSSILYLLQEATKFVTPADQSLDDDPETIPHSPTIHVQEEYEARNKRTVALSVDGSSPWEVMSLINLQCERLLQFEPVNKDEDLRCDSSRPDTKANQVDVLHDPIEAAASECSPAQTFDVAGHSDVTFSTPHVIDEHITYRPEDRDTANVKADALAELITKHTDEGLNLCSVRSEENNHSYLVETSALPLDLSKKVVVLQSDSQTVDEDDRMCCDEPQTSKISSVDFTSSLDMDGDPSMCFSVNDDAEAESSQPPNISTPERDLNNNLEEQKIGEGPHKWSVCHRKPRKQSHPERSPDLQDPELQGVVFSMHPELNNGTNQCRLLITSNYSKMCGRGRRNRGSRCKLQQSSQHNSNSEDENDPVCLSKKICASCCTRKTPLWRDAEDGTPLCNACGIRYKKYRVRCLQCWNIPRKEASSNTKCLKCGDLLRLAAQNKSAGW